MAFALGQHENFNGKNSDVLNGILEHEKRRAGEKWLESHYDYSGYFFGGKLKPGTCRIMKKLQVWDSDIEKLDSNKINDLFFPFQSGGRLKSLNFDGCSNNGLEVGNDRGIEVLRSLKGISSLEHLGFCQSCAEMKPRKPNLFFSEVAKTCSSLPNLRSLSLYWVFSFRSIDDSTRSLLKMVASKGLKKLEIVGNKFNWENPNEIKLGFCPKVFSEFCSLLGDCQELVSLTLSYNGIFNGSDIEASISNAKVINSALKKLSKLKRLEIQRSFINCSGRKSVAKVAEAAFEGLYGLGEIILVKVDLSKEVQRGLESAGFIYKSGETTQVWQNSNN
jgi:hypothetical protein